MKGRLHASFALSAALCLIPSFSKAQSTDIGTYFSIYSSRSVSIPRAISLINYLYARGPSPQPVAFAGNVDCAGGVDLIDVVYLVNYALRGGPAPCDWFGWYREPSDFRDAETMAMWETNEVTAPPGLAARVQSDLQRLRTTPGAEQAALASLHFVPRWIPSRISVMMDSSTYAAMQEGVYHDWDSLNALYEANVGEFYYYDVAGPYFATVTFHGIKNSVLLSQMYAELPGILSAYEEYSRWIGGNPIPDIIYPLIQGDTNTYLFQMSWAFTGIYQRQRYWYGVARPDTAWIVGDWDPRLGPEPAWWEQAIANMERYLDD